MPVIIVNHLPPATTPEQYTRVSEIIVAGGPVDGLLVHTGFVNGDHIEVVDAWESRAHFDAFEERLVAAIKQVVGAEAMLEAGPPDVAEYEPLDFVTA
ncbi:MAG TPA: hypothetical protein VFO60_00500 [Candidatus Dormibacteraeota bacterium]|nr:hypothetical protein [Candidatus Dormibacteraeota bacterium]